VGQVPETVAMPKVGDTAPAIEEPITQGGRFKLSDHAGEWVAVYFYPRANTPG
jgi:peroxiredoxin Q/BCP